MKINTCQYVCASDLFEGQQRVWDAFAESDPNCTWGDANRTLISSECMLQYMEQVDDECTVASDGEDGEPLDKSVIVERLNGLAPEIYIDLEN